MSRIGSIKLDSDHTRPHIVPLLFVFRWQQLMLVLYTLSNWGPSFKGTLLAFFVKQRRFECSCVSTHPALCSSHSVDIPYIVLYKQIIFFTTVSNVCKSTECCKPLYNTWTSFSSQIHTSLKHSSVLQSL